MIKVLLVDDHSIITDGLQKLLSEYEDLSVIGVCRNGEEAMDFLTKHDVQIVLSDIDMPIMNGLELAKALLKKYPFLKVAILSMHLEKSLIEQFVQLGVKGYFTKSITGEELYTAIKTIFQGGEYFPKDVTKSMLKEQSIQPSINQNPIISELSSREIEILKLLSNGMTNKDIADALFISPRTVDTHRNNVMKKLDIHNVAGLVRFAFQNGLTS